MFKVSRLYFGTFLVQVDMLKVSLFPDTHRFYKEVQMPIQDPTKHQCLSLFSERIEKFLPFTVFAKNSTIENSRLSRKKNKRNFIFIKRVVTSILCSDLEHFPTSTLKISPKTSSIVSKISFSYISRKLNLLIFQEIELFEFL